VDPVLALTRLGGVARWGALRRVCSGRRLRRALRDGRIVRSYYGRYALPHADAARAAGSRLTGHVSHTSAALHWGWAVKTAPTVPHVTVSRHRKIAPGRRDGVVLHWRDLEADSVVDGWVTSPMRTVIDCCIDLPFDEALAVFDSSWRAGLKPREVQVAALRLPRRQRDRVLAVARAADPRAANPFESVLRAITMTVPGLSVEPQVVVKDSTFWGRVDLADESLRIVIEAESFEFHGSRKAFDRDCRRYNALVVRGWLVLRFTWEQVMFEPELVAGTLRALVDLRCRRRRRHPADISTGSTRPVSA
jgi:very-short-patch-repair endonuclease